MKIFLRVVIALAVIAVLLVIVGFILPSSVHVERSVVIAASQDEVFEHVNDLRKWNEWSPWHAMEPDATYEFSGPETGVGSKSSWEGEEIGTGTQEITQSERPTRIRTELDFGDQGKASSEWKFEADADDGTKVTWGFDTELGMNPIARYFGLMMDSMIGASYEEGLNRLKEICEADSDDASDSDSNEQPTSDDASSADDGEALDLTVSDESN